MFTIAQIKAAHAKVQSGADFPRYIADIKKLGVRRYVTFLPDGHTEYFGADGFSAATSALWDTLAIAPQIQASRFKERLEHHQQGGTSYLTFCEQCRQVGIDRWEVDLSAMTCTYFGAANQSVLVEAIPEA